MCRTQLRVSYSYVWNVSCPSDDAHNCADERVDGDDVERGFGDNVVGDDGEHDGHDCDYDDIDGDACDDDDDYKSDDDGGGDDKKCEDDGDGCGDEDDCGDGVWYGYSDYDGDGDWRKPLW